MIISAVLLIIIFALYKLLVEGWLWKIILGIFGWIGLYWALLEYFPESKNTCLTFQTWNICWAAAIASVVLIMAMFNTES